MAVDLSFYKSSLVQEVRAEGRAKGRAEGETRRAVEDVLAVLGQRGIDVPREARERITRCDDPGILRTWLLQAATATSIDDVFDAE